MRIDAALVKPRGCTNSLEQVKNAIAADALRSLPQYVSVVASCRQGEGDHHRRRERDQDRACQPCRIPEPGYPVRVM
jgi:hypothetical protein